MLTIPTGMANKTTNLTTEKLLIYLHIQIRIRVNSKFKITFFSFYQYFLSWRNQYSRIQKLQTCHWIFFRKF